MQAEFAILLLLLGLALLVAEIFIPSGGFLLFAALACLGASVWCAAGAWWGSSPAKWWIYISLLVVLIPGAVGGAFYVFPRTSLGRKILLEGPSLDEVTPYVEEEIRLMQLIGKSGKTLTLLNPGGLVLVNEERMHCESEGMLIDSSEVVQIVGVKSNRLVVRLVKPEPGPPPTLQQETDNSDDSRLDFDVPQS
jgi:membrane-bound serine protease (ClpP class)